MVRVGLYQETHLSFDPRRRRGLEEPGSTVGGVEVSEADILKDISVVRFVYGIKSLCGNLREDKGIQKEMETNHPFDLTHSR